MGTQAFADIDKKGKYVFVITPGGNDPNRAIFGLLMAQTIAEKGGGKVYIWMTLDGADLVNKKQDGGDQIPHLQEIWKCT